MDVEKDLGKLLSTYGVTAVTIDVQERIRGRSYEMALVMALTGSTQPATGIVVAIQDEPYGHKVQFGPISGINLKEGLVEGKYGLNLLDYRDIPVTVLKTQSKHQPRIRTSKYRTL